MLNASSTAERGKARFKIEWADVVRYALETMYTGHKFRVETFYRHVQHDNVLRVAVTAKTGELVFVESVYQEVEFDWYGLPPIKEDMKASLMLLVG